MPLPRERWLLRQMNIAAANEVVATNLVEQCRNLGRDGIDFILIREKQLSAGALVSLSRRVKAAAGPARVLITGRADLALAAGLDGVHLTAAPGELTPAQVRRLMPGAWVSVSCHTLDEVRQAAAHDADAVLFGPVFAKVVHGREVGKGVGLAALREACHAAGKAQVFALGGVTLGDAPACLQAGAAGIAGIRLFFERGEL